MINEFRRDVVSGDWVLISSSRVGRPHDERRRRLYQTVAECAFEPERLSGEEPIMTYELGTIVMRNKFPALRTGECGAPTARGPFLTHPAVGFHELVITRDHDRHFAQLTNEETAEVLIAYRDRYLQIAGERCGAYISIFHNHGSAAGASVYHNHSQIISTPIVPPEVLRSLDGADEYLAQTGKPIYRTVIDWETQQAKRIVYENDLFIALCPFVSRAGYEVRVFPRRHEPRFESTTDGDILACADALATVLKKLFVALDDVDYNFYIRTAPVAKDPLVDVSAFHWHIDIIPRIPIAAGFELSTAVYINSYDPDDCAEHLRNTKIRT